MTRIKDLQHSKDVVEAIVASSLSIAEVIRKLGMKPSIGTSYRTINQYLRVYDLDTSHFTGQGWSRGHNSETHNSISRARFFNTVPNSEVFVKNSERRVGGCSLKRRLIELGVVYSCSCCGLLKWLNKDIALHLDHVNGIPNDNRIDNLRFLCPNCHQQTETWGSGNRKLLYKKAERVTGKLSGQRSVVSRPTRRPDKDTLEMAVWSMPTTKVAKEYGVSDKAVEKWCKFYHIEKPGRGYWRKFQSNAPMT